MENYQVLLDQLQLPVDKNHNPARNEGESFEDYKVRRRNSNQAINWYLQSLFPEQLRWNSLQHGIFRKKDHPTG